MREGQDRRDQQTGDQEEDDLLVQSGRSTCEFTSPLWQVGWNEGLDRPAGLLVDEFPGVRSVEATNAHRGDEFGIEVP